VVNSGLIVGGAGASGGTGGDGIFSTGLVIDSGTIEGGGNGSQQGDAVRGGTLVIDPGASFVGAVDVLTLALAGSVASTLTGVGKQFHASGAIVFEAGAHWTVEGDLAGLAAGAVIDGFTLGDEILLDGVSVASETYVTGVGLELGIGGGETTLAIAGSFNSGDFMILNTSAGANIVFAGAPAPILTTPAALAIGINMAAAIGGISISQVAGYATEIFTVKLNDSHGLLSASGADVYGDGTTRLTLTGSLGEVNAALATVKDDDPLAGADRIVVRALGDQGFVGAVDTIAVSATVATGGTPEITAPAAKTLTAGKATAISNVALKETPTLAGETFTLTVSDHYGVLAATGNGVLGAGTKHLTFSGSLEQVNADLAKLTDTELSAGTDTLVLRASDSDGSFASATTIAITNSGTLGGATPLILGANEASDGLTVAKNTSEFAESGAALRNTMIDAGGAGGVLSGGTASNVGLEGGVLGIAGAVQGLGIMTGTAITGAGGDSKTTTVQNGVDYVLTGGTVSNTTIADGGVLVVEANGSIGGTLDFAASDAVLSLAGTVLPTAEISGFDRNGASGDAIVLSGFRYKSGADTATLGAGNVLTLDLNGEIALQQLNPSQSESGVQFSIITNSLDQVVVIETGKENTQDMNFLATASAAGSTARIDDVSSRWNDLLADFSSGNPAGAAFKHDVKKFAAIAGLDSVSTTMSGMALSTHDLTGGTAPSNQIGILFPLG
jgi:autotransporter passenger strand-loop-strand repeat protein